jgi:hypothetical protein
MAKTYNGHIPVDQLLENAKEQKLVDVLVVGWRENGKLYAASTSGRVEDIVELLNATKRHIGAVEVRA